jgi:hypothetical protein
VHCETSTNLDVHHVRYQSHGGPHEMTNVTVMCSAHHTLVHEGRLRVTGKAPALAYERRSEDDDSWRRIT